MIDKRDNREARLAEQLRKNLKRRKQQARARIRAAEDCGGGFGGNPQENQISHNGVAQPEIGSPQNKTKGT